MKKTKLFGLLLLYAALHFMILGAAYDDIEGGIGGGYAYATSYDDLYGNENLPVSYSYYDDEDYLSSSSSTGSKIRFEFPNTLCDRIYWEDVCSSFVATIKVYYTDGTSKSIVCIFGTSSSSLNDDKYVNYITIECMTGAMGEDPTVLIDQLRCRLA